MLHAIASVHFGKPDSVKIDFRGVKLRPVEFIIGYYTMSKSGFALCEDMEVDKHRTRGLGYRPYLDEDGSRSPSTA